MWSPLVTLLYMAPEQSGSGGLVTTHRALVLAVAVAMATLMGKELGTAEGREGALVAVVLVHLTSACFLGAQALLPGTHTRSIGWGLLVWVLVLMVRVIEAFPLFLFLLLVLTISISPSGFCRRAIPLMLYSKGSSNRSFGSMKIRCRG